MSDSQPRFQDVSARVDFPALDARILEFWKANDIFHKSLEGREDAPIFVFYEGPPTANGKPGSHHVLSRIFKDLFPRYKTMRGYRVPRKAGWDTHGLPVELEVERRLGIDGKGQIEAYGVAEFNALCRESVTTYLAEWERFTERIGFWVDLDDAYFTFTNDYIESVWWLLRQIWDKDLLYQGHKVVPVLPALRHGAQQPRGGAGLQGRHRGLHLRALPAQGRRGGEASRRAWTASPGPSRSPSGPPRRGRSSATSRPRCTRTWSTRSWRAAASASSWPATSSTSVLGKQAEVLREFRGADLLGLDYEPLFDVPAAGASGRTSSSAATSSPPPTAPASCTSRRRSARTTCAWAWPHDLPVVNAVDLEGRFIAEVTPWAGSFVKDADPAITHDLKERGLLLGVEPYEHSYPFCWRCDTPLLYYAKPTWYIRTTAVKDELIAANDAVNWHPEHIKTGRFGEWLADNIDWALSRERYWGTPLPIWRCEQGHTHCVGSVARAPGAGGRSRSGGSGTPPAVRRRRRAHLPRVRRRDAPRARGHRRLVRLRLHAVRAVALPVRERGDVRGALPRRLHLRGHRPDPRLVLQPARHRHAHRGAQLVQARPLPRAHPRRRGPEDEQEQGQRGQARTTSWTTRARTRSAGTCSAASSRGARGASAPRWSTRWCASSCSRCGTRTASSPCTPTSTGSTRWRRSRRFTDRPLLDRWLVGELNTLVQDVTAGLESYDATGTARRIQEFVDDLSNWYVRRSRRRFWKSESDADKLAAYHTLYEALVTVVKLLAPFTPFVAEELYQNLVRSVDAERSGERAPVRLARGRRAGRRRRRELRHGGGAACRGDGPRGTQRRGGQDAAAAGRGGRGSAGGRGSRPWSASATSFSTSSTSRA